MTTTETKLTPHLVKNLFYGIPLIFLLFSLTEIVFFGNLTDSFFSQEIDGLITIVFAALVLITSFLYKKSRGELSKRWQYIFGFGVVMILLFIAFYLYLVFLF